jgi:hypothetical protein
MADDETCPEPDSAPGDDDPYEFRGPFFVRLFTDLRKPKAYHGALNESVWLM